MKHAISSTAYVITANNKKTGLLEGYYSHGTTFFEISPSIWYAKFLMTLKSANKYHGLLLKGMPENIKGEPLKWKIQEVAIGVPVDVK